MKSSDKQITYLIKTKNGKNPKLFIGMNINHIELTYENLYNEDRDIRKKELDKVIGEDKVHWLLHKNMLDKLNPKFKYTNLPRTYNHKDIL